MELPTPALDTRYLFKLFKGRLKASCVIGAEIRSDVLHSVFQYLLVPYISLHKVPKARHILGDILELEGKGKEG